MADDPKDPPKADPPKPQPATPEQKEIFRNAVMDIASIHDDLDKACINSELGGGRGLVPAMQVRKSIKDLENLFNTLKATL